MVGCYFVLRHGTEQSKKDSHKASMLKLVSSENNSVCKGLKDWDRLLYRRRLDIWQRQLSISNFGRSSIWWPSNIHIKITEVARTTWVVPACVNPVVTVWKDKKDVTVLNPCSQMLTVSQLASKLNTDCSLISYVVFNSYVAKMAPEFPTCSSL